MAKEETKTINDFAPLVAKQKFTSPPSRYSDVSLCGELDKLGILRPSMANGTITNLLKQRGYITIKGSIEVTSLGIDVSDFLIQSGFEFMDTKFTANMEEELDEISEGKKERVALLDKFYHGILAGIKQGQELKESKSQTDFDCPKCGAKLNLKHSKFGKFFACSNYQGGKGCTYKGKVGEDGTPVEVVVKPKEYSEYKCPKCDGKMVKRTSKYGEFVGCEQYPSCAGMRTVDGDEIVKKNTKKKWKKKNAED